MSASFEGKVAVVTGGASGIGRAIVIRLLDAGANVLIADVDLPSAQTLAGTSSAATALHCDVSKPNEVQDAVQTAVDAFGGLDVMINNAGDQFCGRPYR